MGFNSGFKGLSVKLYHTVHVERACYVRALCGLLNEGSASVLQQRSLQASGLPTRRVWNRIKQLHHRFRLGLQILFYPKEFTTRVKSTAVTSTTRDLPAAEARAICGIISVLSLLTAVVCSVSVSLLVNLLHRLLSDDGTEMKC